MLQKLVGVVRNIVGGAFPKKHLVVYIWGFFSLPDFRTFTPSPVVCQNNAKSANTTK